MAQSSELAHGDPVLASQYNDLRDDILSATLGHRHTGNSDGRQLETASFISNSIHKTRRVKRDRWYLEPATGGWDYTSSSPIKRSARWGGGLMFPSFHHCVVYGRVGGALRPIGDYTDYTIVVRALIHTSGGDIYIRHGGEAGGCGYAYDEEATGWSSWGAVDVSTADFFTPFLLPEFTIDPSELAGAPPFFSIKLERDATHASDSGGYMLSCVGWLVKYPST